MTAHTPPKAAADEGLDRVDRGERILAESQLIKTHDGKERAIFVQPKKGELPPDTAGIDGPSQVTTEDVVQAPSVASAWEAIEDEE